MRDFAAYRKTIVNLANTRNDLSTNEIVEIAEKHNTTCRNVLGAFNAAYSISILKRKENKHDTRMD